VNDAVISRAPGCPALVRCFGRYEQPVAAALLLNSVRVVLVADIDPDRQALDAKRRRSFEVELQQADAELFAHLRDPREQARPVRLQAAQGRKRRVDAAGVPAVRRVEGAVVLLH
jgi:hypothetical protein